MTVRRKNADKKSKPFPHDAAAVSIIHAAVYLGVSRATIYRILSNPHAPITTARIAGRRVVTRASLDAFLASASEGQQVPTPGKAA